jgi:hypothetical protein
MHRAPAHHTAKKGRRPSFGCEVGGNRTFPVRAQLIISTGTNWQRNARMATTVSRKGQVLIPDPIRDRPGFQSVAMVDFSFDAEGRVILTKVGTPPPKSSFTGLDGRAGCRPR